MILKKKYKIATILPYKESYTLENASAVSLWVSEFFNKSKFKKNNYIYGNANTRNYLTNNYINVPLKNLKIKFRSTSNEYIEKLSKKLIEEKFDIIEIHNRPLVLFINFLSNFSKNRFCTHLLTKIIFSTFFNIFNLSLIELDPFIESGSL